MKRELVGLLVACCLISPLSNVTLSSAADQITPAKTETMTQVMSKQLSGALKNAYVSDIKISRADKRIRQVQEFTIPTYSTVTVYCGFYRSPLFNYNVGVYTDAEGKNRVQGGYAARKIGETGAELAMTLPAGKYYVIAEEIYISQYQQTVEKPVHTTTGSSIEVTTETKYNEDTLTNKLYMGVAYLPSSGLVTHTTKNASGKVTITVDARASSNTYDSDIVALQYAEGYVSESSDIWITQRSKAVDPRYSTDAVTVMLPTKEKQNGTKVFNMELTGTYTFKICVSNGTKLDTYMFTEKLDCTAPKIEGVEEGEIYNKEVSVSSKDSEGSYVTLTLNGKSYVAGTPIKENGKYRIVAKDSYGNVSRCKFTIKIKKGSQ